MEEDGCGSAATAAGATLRARWVTTLRARWMRLRARWVTLIARWVTLRARWMRLRARWVTLRARWVTTQALRSFARTSHTRSNPELSFVAQPHLELSFHQHDDRFELLDQLQAALFPKPPRTRAQAAHERAEPSGASPLTDAHVAAIRQSLHQRARHDSLTVSPTVSPSPCPPPCASLIIFLTGFSPGGVFLRSRQRHPRSASAAVRPHAPPRTPASHACQWTQRAAQRMFAVDRKPSSQRMFYREPSSVAAGPAAVHSSPREVSNSS
jgi:hypothetical protein